ncbi:hypothetical protein NUW54_g13706 [Trametes sanguinea]|uniref:Uncharacterized protein n=1 Tax=Trametes sanguinea TaxID=158606 RepID=A0ACC1MJH8_9APHY|nr:hypothetical protein NUW54_g13706 [Trametes sanguinea]
MVRNHTPPGQPYNPYEATFRVPQSVTKTDIRSYLLAVYGVQTTYIRTDTTNPRFAGARVPPQLPSETGRRATHALRAGRAGQSLSHHSRQRKTSDPEREGKSDALVLVHRAQAVLVAALEPPELALAQAMEDRALQVALDEQLVVFDAEEDGDHDEFAHGRHDPRRLSRAERGADGDADVDLAGMLPKLGFTFTLGGQRRRVSFGFLVPRWATRTILPEGPVGLGRAGGRYAFALRIFMDLVYIAWPAVLLWVLCAWRLQ